MRRTIFSVLLLVLVSGCSLFGSEPTDELAEARARWSAASVEDYAFTLSVGCFCGHAGQYAIDVQDGEVASIERVDEMPISGSILDLVSLTVEDLFIVIEDAFEGDADDVLVEYDPDLGYPVSISIDFIREAVDDEISYSVQAFSTAG